MAVYNEILVGRFNRFIQKVFGMKGPPPARQLSGEITTVFPLPNGNENRYLEGWVKAAARAETNAVAAQDSVVRFVNPLGSGAIVVVEKIVVVPNIPMSGFLDFAYPAAGPFVNLANLVTGVAFDTRFKFNQSGTGGPASQVSWANNIPQIGLTCLPIAVSVALGDQEVVNTINQEFPVLPGSAFQVRTATQNVDMAVGIMWRERAIEDSEI